MNSQSIAQQTIRLHNGIQLAYYDSKEDTTENGAAAPAPAFAAEKPVVVLLHGFCGSSAYWERILPHLKPHARIIAPDLRGQGHSAASSDDVYAMELYADDLAHMLDELAISSSIVLGHSLGGYITLAFAEKYPEKLRAFGLLHSTALPDSEAAKENRDKAVTAIYQEGIGAFVEGLVPKLFAPAHKQSMPELIERVQQIGYATSEAGAAGAARGMKERPDRTAVLEQTKLPLLLLAGVEDQVIPVESTLLADGPNVTRVKLENAGHMGMVEQPAAFAEEIRSFIAKC